MFIINKTIVFVIVFGNLIISTATYAVILTYDVVGDKIKYQTSTPAFVSGAYKTTNFDNINLRPAKAWVPGQISNSIHEQLVSFVSNTGDNFELRVQLKGVEYSGIKSGSNGFSYIDSDVSGGSNIGIYNNSDTIEINQPGEYHDKMFSTNSSSIEPFTLVRPLFHIDESDLLKKLNGKLNGTYRAIVPIPFKYRVKYLDTLVWSYEQRVINLNIEIKYLGSTLERITVVGDGQFVPSYSDISSRVSSKTSYDIKASGNMPNGISMRFINNSRAYVMINKNQTDNSRSDLNAIPYSIKCVDGITNIGICKNTLLVDNGRYSTDERVIVEPTTNSKAIDFKLELSFETDVKRSGDYEDSFVVLFEVVL